jgi:hypothetical protein
MVRLRSNVIKEIQCLISVACLSALPDRPCGSVKKADLEDDLFRLFHGPASGNPPNGNDGDKIACDDSSDQTSVSAALGPGDSFVSMFFEGRNQFASAFDVEQHATHIRYGPMTKASASRSCPHKVLNPQRLVLPIGSFTGGWRFTFLAPWQNQSCNVDCWSLVSFRLGVCALKHLFHISTADTSLCATISGADIGFGLRKRDPSIPHRATTASKVSMLGNHELEHTLQGTAVVSKRKECSGGHSMPTAKHAAVETSAIRTGPVFNSLPHARVSESPPQQLFFEESCSSDDSSVCTDDSSDSSDDDDNDDALLMAMLIGTTFCNDALLMAMMFSTLNSRSRRY